MMDTARKETREKMLSFLGEAVLTSWKKNTAWNRTFAYRDWADLTETEKAGLINHGKDVVGAYLELLEARGG